MDRTWPVTIVAATVFTYWLCVFLMVARSWVKFRGPAGALPKTRLERRMWIAWVPNTAAWIALPWATWGRSGNWLVADTPLWNAAGWPAAIVALAAFWLTTRCWFAMGSNWTMAVNPKKKTELLTGGAFGVVRHPIYALSLLLMACTMIAVPVWPMWLVGMIHAAMILTKAVSEERYLRQVHGPSYEQYCRRTNRFVPFRYLWGQVRPSPTG